MYRLDVIFKGYKWDPQFLDNNTIAKHILVITEEELYELETLVERLDKETTEAEQFLNKNLKTAKPLALPKQTRKELWRMKNYEASKHIRLQRYDFHPIIEGGWAVSETNSDVPGGFAEASIMPIIAMNLLEKGKYWHRDFGEIIVNALQKKTRPNGRIMFVHCTSYSDDRQAMQFLGDKLANKGFNILYGAADHLNFENNKAISVLDGNKGEVDCIFRFTPLDWLIGIKPKRWQGYFDTTTPSCNHPIAVFAQTKRFPFVWESLERNGINLSAWRKLLPETVKVSDAKNKKGFVYKPVLGRVGEGITIKEACRDDEYEKIMKEVKRKPKRYIAQKRFNSLPLNTCEGEQFHICLGVYTVEGKAAGFYSRISKTPRIDSGAADIPVLIERSKK